MRIGFRAVALVAALLVLTVPLPASAQDSPPPAAPPGFTPESIVFPVVGAVSYIDSFGAPRGDHSHEGVDIMAEKMLPVVAAADGVVDWIGSDCCYLSIDHGGGWETWYIHLNNDTPGTDDGLGHGIVEGLVPGTPVSQGQQIGWVGDSGNAEEAGSHLHFEIRKDGVAMNPYPFVTAAPPLTEPGGPAALQAADFFTDDDESEHEANIDTMFQLGVTRGCNPPANDRYCPADWLTRGQVAAFLRRNLSAPTVTEDHFTDDAGSEFEEDINALAAIGVAFGCTESEFCVSDPLTRAEMAEFLVRAYDYANPEAEDFFVDDTGNRFAASIDALRAAGVTRGCNPPDNTNYCPESPLTRAEMATFLARAIGEGA